MAEKPPERSIGSKILRDRAMAMLRETRAKIDPKLLDAMKDHLTAIMKPPEGSPVPGKPDAAGNSTMQLHKAEPSGAADLSKPVVSSAATAPMPGSPAARRGAPVYPAASFDDVPSAGGSSGSEPVDRQKIAQIVLNYMKNREETQKH